MSSITSSGPEGYEFQYLVTVWVTLLLWENAELRVLTEDGEDFRVETGPLPDGPIDVQVKSTGSALSIGSLADIVARFGKRQSKECTFDRMLAGQRVMVVTGGSCTSDTERYRSASGDLSGSVAVSADAGRAFLAALARATTDVTSGTELDQQRRQHLVDLANTKLAEARQALRYLSVWDRLDKAFVRERCIGMIRRLRIAVDHAENVLDELAGQVRGAANKADVVPALRKVIEHHRIDRRSDPNRVPRTDEPAILKRLRRDHVVLLSGPPRCGKTETGRLLLDQVANDGYLIEEYDSADEARLFLSQGGRHRACLLNDPLGTRGLLKGSSQGMRELRTAVDATGPGRLLIVAQSRDELLTASGVDSLDRCRLPQATWQSLDAYPSGFLSDVWEGHVQRHQLSEKLAAAVTVLLHEGAHVEVGALEMVAANPDLLPDQPSRDDLWRAFRQEAGDLTQHLVAQHSEALADLILLLAMMTTPHLPVEEREVAFVLGDTEELPSLGSGSRTSSLGGNDEAPSPPVYGREPHLDKDVEAQLDQLEQRRLVGAVGNALQFRHAFYRAAAEWWAKSMPRRRSRNVPGLVRKALFSASPRTARATAANLPILFALLNDNEAQTALLDLAAEGLDSRYPAVRDLCHRFLLTHHSSGSEDEEERKERLLGGGIYDDRLYEFEWSEGEAWFPEQSSIQTEIIRKYEVVSRDRVVHTLAQLTEGPETAPPPEDAAFAVRYLKDHPHELTARVMENLLSYDLSAIRAEASEAWLSCDREDDEHIRRRIFSDPAPVVAYCTFRSVAKAFTGYSEARRQLLARDIAQAAEAQALSANAFLQTMSKYDRPHVFVKNPPWELFAQALPAAFRGLGKVQTFDATNLWATLSDDALPHLSAEQVVQICTAWRDVLEEWPGNSFRDYDFAGIVPILIKGTADAPEARAELSQKLLRTLNTPLQIVLLKDFLDQWDGLTGPEKETIRDRLTGNHPEKAWYQAMALTQDEVPPEVQEWVTGDSQALALPPEELRARLDPELFTACIHMHAGHLYPLPALGVNGKGRETWRPVMDTLRTSGQDDNFLLALEEALNRRDETAVRVAVEAADEDRLQQVFDLMLAHEIAYRCGWLPTAWDALLARATTPDLRDQWLDKMAEVAPGIVEEACDLLEWMSDDETRTALLQRLPADATLLTLLRAFRKMDTQEEDIVQHFMNAIGQVIDIQPPRIMGIYRLIQDTVSECAPQAPLLDKLEQQRRMAVQEWRRVRDEGRPPYRFIKDWTRPPRPDE